MSLPKRTLALIAACLPVVALASGPQLKLPAFSHLQHLATDSVDISLGPGALGLAARLLAHDDSPDAQDAQTRELLRGLKGIYIRSYEFSGDDLYPAADIDAVREQLSGPEWSPLTQLRTERDGEKVDVFVCMTHDKVSGLAVIASDRRNFTIVNVVGSFDLRQLGKLSQHFGLPHLSL
jgi:Domain of unknown function (DUF4252)